MDKELRESAGAHRVATGTMNPYYSALQNELTAQLTEVPEALGKPQVPRVALDNYLAQLEAHGRTGQAWDDTALGEGRDRDQMPMTTLQREASRDPAMAANSGRPVLLGASAKRGGPKPLLVAEVSIHQAPDGTIIEQVLVRSSGNPIFDRFVMEAAPKSVASMPPPPREGGGIRKDGLRSHWAFEGHMSLMKKVRDFILPQDLPYLTAILGTGQFAGSFDFTALQDTEVVDWRDPRWRLKARLLRVD